MMYTWRREWVHIFESPWGIIERFKYANAAKGIDVINVLGTQESFLHPLKKGSRNLFSLEGFDDDKSKSILGVSLLEHIHKFYERFLEPFNGKKSFYLRKHLAFCETCMEIGYHSLFHQFILLEDCPFHKEKLLTRCPECGHEIPYEINMRHSFSCLCGKLIFNESYSDSFIKLWEKTNLLKLQVPQLTLWFKWNDVHRNKYKDVILLMPKDPIIKGTEIIRNIFSTINMPRQNNQIPTTCSINSGIIPLTIPVLPPSKFARSLSKHPATKIVNEVNELSFVAYLDIVMNPIFKSIARHYRKTILSKEKHQKKGKPFMTLAYYLWRRQIESFNITLLMFRKTPSFSYLDFIIDISHNIDRLDKDNDDFIRLEFWPTRVWVISHILSHYMLKLYRSYLSFCENNYDNLVECDETLTNMHRVFRSVKAENMSYELPLFIIERSVTESKRKQIIIYRFDNNKIKIYENPQ